MTVRLARPGDAAAVLSIYGPFVRDTHVSFEARVPTEDEMAKRIGATLPAWPWLVAETDAGVVGYAYAGSHRHREAYQWSVEASVYVVPGARRRGVARTLYEALLDVLRLQGYASVYAGIALPNPASLGFHRALGFEPIGVYRRVGFKRGAWRDVEWLGVSLGDGAAPDSPRPLDAVAPAVAARLADAGRRSERRDP